MDDPQPENIQGSKQVVHKVEHQINWGHVALAVGVLTALYVGHQVLSHRNSVEDENQMEVISS